MIASSPTDVKPVLNAIVESACKLCEASDAYVALKDGDYLVFQTQHGSIPVAWKRRPINRQWPAGRAVVDGKSVHLRDVLGGEGDEFPDGREIARHDGARTVLTVPLTREDESIGVIILRRTEVLPFTDKQIALLRTFADQAVIAIENTRLFNETQEALERQTATADILKVIASSPSDVQPVFEAIAASANRLVGGFSCTVVRFIDGTAYLKAFTPTTQEADEILQASFPSRLPDLPFSGGKGWWSHASSRYRSHDRPNPGYLAGPRLPQHAVRPAGEQGRDDRGDRCDSRSARLLRRSSRATVENLRRPGRDRHQNVHLFDQLQHRTDDLAESLQQQTATSEVLQIISSSPSNLAPVFDKMLESATRVCGAEFGSMFLLEGDALRQAALYNAPAALVAARINKVRPIHPRSAINAAIRSKQVVHIEDVSSTPAYFERAPAVVELVELAGARTIVVVPMLRDEEAIGVITVYRQEVRPFGDKQDRPINKFRQAGRDRH